MKVPLLTYLSCDLKTLRHSTAALEGTYWDVRMTKWYKQSMDCQEASAAEPTSLLPLLVVRHSSALAFCSIAVTSASSVH